VCEALLLLLLLSLTPKTKPPYLKFLLHKKKKNTVLQIFNKPRPKSSVLSYNEIEFLVAAIVDGKHFLRSGSRENLKSTSAEEIMNDGSSTSGMQQHYCIRLSSTNTHLYVHVYNTCMYIYTYMRYVFVVVCIWDMYVYTRVYVCVGLAFVGKDIVFRFIIEYSNLRIFSPYVVGLFLYEHFWKMIFGLVLKLEIIYRVMIF
jgi:hypothetical protein